MSTFIEELRWRGMLNDAMPGSENKLKTGMQSAYIGFDPTAQSLHIGSLATIMLLVYWQRDGHKPYALVGGATGMVGDPTGKAAERKLLDEETLAVNVAAIRKQLAHFLDFENGANSAELVNNLDWFKGWGYLDFLREVGKHFSINYMIAKDSVKNRLETGMSYTEFSYQLLQAYDFYHLWKNNGINFQMGASDQWGNITGGTELIRRMDSGEAYAITGNLLLKADGTKFGKSESGNVWLDPELTSPYKFYQFLLNCADEEAFKMVRIFCVRAHSEIEELEARHTAEPHLRILQKTVAEDLTLRVHGAEELKRAQQATDILFGKDSTEAIKALDEKLLLQAFEGVPAKTLPVSDLDQDLVTLLGATTEGIVFPSKGEARKGIQAGSITINGTKADSIEAKAADFGLLQEKYLLIRKGKKNYILLTFEN
jgi:tyrosyl-tRNA synthetase